ncbi:MAG TPA: EamA family transporter [Erwinia sp.]|uniref:DMT family transporter n=1 Tax=Erwinia citreus TaxID=558 RepID=UPI000E7E1023|nr:DMT family transporter [Erwinia sp.]HBV40246.1 EamA family transporter [Erwinia sp.]
MKNKASGWASGLAGVVIFAGSMPATRLAVADFTPLFLTSARAGLAATVALMLLSVCRQRMPQREDLLSLTIVALGVVIGFPLLTAFALQGVSAAHSLMYLGLLPLCTAAFSVLRGERRPKPAFWLFSLVGGAVVASYALAAKESHASWRDLLMIAAVIICGAGYAEGACLARRLGGWQTIAWALALALPAALPLAVLTWPVSFREVAFSAWMGLGYVSLFSMLIGFIFWYHGLAKGGTAAVGQLQLLQPFIGFGFAALFLHESIDGAMLACASAALICVAGAKKFA